MRINMRKPLAAALVSLGIMAACSLPARANILDEVQVQPDNYSNVVRITFNSRIQFVRFTQSDKTKTAQIYFRILQGTDLTIKSTESLRSRPFESIPGVTVSYLPQSGAQVRKLDVQFSKSKQADSIIVRAGSSDRSLDIVFGDKATKRQAVEEARRYTINLFSTESKDEIGSKLVPREYQDHAIFTTQQVRDNKSQYELNLGYFATLEEAEKIRSGLVAQFPGASVVDLKRRRQDILDAVSAKARPSLDQAQSMAVQASTAEVEDQAAALMPQAQQAQASGNYDAAINTLNRVLLLPPNKFSQDAQEQVGVAREQNGQTDRARAEYELYLKLFPEGPGTDRVRQHLAKLGTTQSINAGSQQTAAEGQTVTKTVTGSLSQYYYGGKSQTQTAFNTSTTPGTPSISSSKQSSLRTNIDLNARYRDDSKEQKLVFRLDNTRSFIDTVPNRNRVNSLFYEYKGLQNGFNTRLGRQSGTSGGAPGRFDGAMLSYRFQPKWRANFIAGLPVEFPNPDSNRKFAGVSVDADNIGGHWGGNAFYFNQQVDGIQDREATGGELRYFQERLMVSALVDFDVSYNLLNIGTLQGNWTSTGGTMFNFLLDRRRAPSLATTDALYNQTVTSLIPVPTSIKQLLLVKTEDQIRALAESTSAISEQSLIGMTMPLNSSWQLGSDLGLSRTGALPAVTLADGTTLAATPATGNIYTFSLRGIGTNLFSTQDVNVFTLSLNKGDLYHGELLAYNNVTNWERWTLEPSLQYYQQQTQPSTDLARWTPGMRLTYKLKDSLSFEADYSFDYSVTDDTVTRDVAKNHSFYVGYRWDI